MELLDCLQIDPDTMSSVMAELNAMGAVDFFNYYGNLITAESAPLATFIRIAGEQSADRKTVIETAILVYVTIRRQIQLKGGA